MESITSSTVLLALGDFLTVYLYRYMHKTFYKKRNWTQKYPVLYYLVYFVDFVLLLWANLQQYPPLNLCSMILGFLIPMFICFEVTSIRGIAYYLFYMAGVLMMELIMGASLGYLNNDMGFQAQYEVITPGISLIMNLVEIMLVLSICKFAYKDKNKRLYRPMPLFLIMPFSTIILVVTDAWLLADGKMVSFNPDQYVRSIAVLVFVNIVVFILLEKYTEIAQKDMSLMEEKLKAQSDADIMSLATRSMEGRLAVAEQVMQRDRVMRHDRRHFEALLLSLLQEDRVEEARKCLEERLQAEPHSTIKYCENTTINAAIEHYVNWAKREEIPVTISANIPVDITVDELELAITISNLLENAIHANRKAPVEKRYIRLTARYKEQLLLEVENYTSEKVRLDEEGYPFSEEANHGIGTRSVLAFVGKTEGTISYTAEEHMFRVRMIIGA